MRTPDEDGAPEDGTTSGSVGDGFGTSAGELTDGFGEDDFSDGDDTGFGDGDTGDSSDTTGDGGSSFGDGLSDAEAENVLVEILEDVFGDDAPDVLEDMEDATGLDSGELYQGLDEADAFVGVADDGMAEAPFDSTDLPTNDDFDLTRDGHVDSHDLHEAAHPFDFDITN